MVCHIKRLFYQVTYKLAVVVKPVITRILPAGLSRKIKKAILKKAYPLENNYSKGKIIDSPDLEKGVNLLGYARAEMGIGESCRIAARNLEAVGIPFGILNFTGTNSARMDDTSWMYKEINKPKYNVNIFHINAEQMMEIYASYGNELFQNKYNIGYWHWELPDFPEEWIENFSLVDEIWAPSTFVVDSIALKSPVPVVKIPHSIEVNIEVARSREFFQLPQDTFLFLAMYDVKSYQERKNPGAAIASFKAAFRPDDLSVGLVLKVNCYKSNQHELNYLDSLIADYRNIYLIKETISRNDVNALIEVTDCFVSLHRSEGFGLGLAEAMYLGKPVIGTNWSSNTDFMNNSNSCLVDYKLVPVGQDYGPYKSYQYWADPDVGHAAQYMARLASDQEYYNKIARTGESHIKKYYSPQVIGELIQRRLDYIHLWKFGG